MCSDNWLPIIDTVPWGENKIEHWTLEVKKNDEKCFINKILKEKNMLKYRDTNIFQQTLVAIRLLYQMFCLYIDAVDKNRQQQPIEKPKKGRIHNNYNMNQQQT